MQLAGTPVVSVRDLSVLVRGPLQTGVDATARVLRGDQLLTRSAII